MWQTNRQMDRRTNEQTKLRWLKHALAVPAFARKNYNCFSSLLKNSFWHPRYYILANEQLLSKVYKAPLASITVASLAKIVSFPLTQIPCLMQMHNLIHAMGLLKKSYTSRRQYYGVNGNEKKEMHNLLKVPKDLPWNIMWTEWNAFRHYVNGQSWLPVSYWFHAVSCVLLLWTCLQKTAHLAHATLHNKVQKLVKLQHVIVYKYKKVYDFPTSATE